MLFAAVQAVQWSGGCRQFHCLHAGSLVGVAGEAFSVRETSLIREVPFVGNLFSVQRRGENIGRYDWGDDFLAMIAFRNQPGRFGLEYFEDVLDRPRPLEVAHACLGVRSDSIQVLAKA